MSPMVSKSEGEIFYIDHDTTENIRAKYADDPNVDCEMIAPIDFVYRDNLSASVRGMKFDYIIASHVFEHIPDPIGWLNECAECLKPGGHLGLAIPDKRFTFDLPRQLTSLADWIGAFAEKRKKPSPASVFESAMTARDGVITDTWPVGHALESLDRYIDVHCTVCTAESFSNLMSDARKLGLHPFAIEAMFEPANDWIEFQARLRIA